MARRIVARQADVHDVEGQRSALEQGIAELGVPQIVLANAGIGVGGPNSSDQDWHDVIAGDRLAAAGRYRHCPSRRHPLARQP
jgi:NAD(P)-dependent dehydrogenase (short-subunit alcohol dehydrogenase family)